MNENPKNIINSDNNSENIFQKVDKELSLLQIKAGNLQ